MNFSSMDYFVMVARERSFSRAAERLHITQQTLSAHIAKLEGELGTKLLVRSIPLELTYAGEVFLEYALDLQRRVSSLEREFQDISENQRGLLRIGITYTRGDIVMPPLLIRFQQPLPQHRRPAGGGHQRQLLQCPAGERGDRPGHRPPACAAARQSRLEDFYQEEYRPAGPQGASWPGWGRRRASAAFARLAIRGPVSPPRTAPSSWPAHQGEQRG